MITLKQLKRAARIDGEKFVYFSSGSLWWTHLQSDVDEATIAGRKYFLRELKNKVNRQDVSPQEKKMLLEISSNQSKGLPCDPVGFPIKKMNYNTWLEQSLSNPEHFGKHGLNAFVFTHHQNCKSFFSNKWDSYNDYIDKLWKKI